MPEQELQDHGRRELRRTAETAAACVELAGEPEDRSLAGEGERVRRGIGVGCGKAASGRLAGAVRTGPSWPCSLAGQCSRNLPGLRGYLAAVLAPGTCHPGDQALELGPWEVSAAEERLAVRRHEHCHRPAALTCHRLGSRHVHGVDVRSFLAVDLDRH